MHLVVGLQGAVRVRHHALHPPQVLCDDVSVTCRQGCEDTTKSEIIDQELLLGRSSVLSVLPEGGGVDPLASISVS